MQAAVEMTTGGLFAGKNFSFEQGECLGLARGMHSESLQTRQDRGQFVAAIQRQANLFNRSDLKIRLVLEMIAHGVRTR